MPPSPPVIFPLLVFEHEDLLVLPVFLYHGFDLHPFDVGLADLDLLVIRYEKHRIELHLIPRLHVEAIDLENRSFRSLVLFSFYLHQGVHAIDLTTNAIFGMKITQLHRLGQGGEQACSGCRCQFLDNTAPNDYIEYNEGNAMAMLNIRNLSNSVHKRLRIRAAQHGRSMEAEARAILTEACGGAEQDYTPENLPGLIAQLYGGAPPQNTVENLIAERRQEAKREK